ncbi:cysteine ABC transporter substrate-binding protein [Lautropia mirabilis]|uniref:cysteine ABC transporter substrate-binding protein n=1 Tax=Lautropia mirabilis TaxID=47671 RepID=UPI0028ECCD4F|nr:cysteine ABC transporter substrate-binding protein [Lautropia mirabilis]
MKFAFKPVLMAALLAAGVASGSHAMAADDGLARIKASDRIRIGVFGDKPPFGYIDSEGKSQGFDVEIAKDFAKDLLGSPDKVEYVITEAANRVEYLKSGKVDIILANFTQTKERARVVDFAAPYMKVSLGVVSPTKAPIKSVDELEGKTLLVNKGTTADAYFSKKYPDISLLKYDQNTETFDALKDGRGAALAHDNALLWAWAKENPGYEVAIGQLGEPEFIAPAVKKGDDALRAWIDQEVAKLKQDGRLKAAYEKTLRPVYGDKVPAEQLLAE